VAEHLSPPTSAGSRCCARTFCERARQAIEKLRCPPVERIIISVGVAEVDAGETVGDALARAAKRLYEAKRAGRNSSLFDWTCRDEALGCSDERAQDPPRRMPVRQGPL
jgi:hypothetical protein